MVREIPNNRSPSIVAKGHSSFIVLLILCVCCSTNSSGTDEKNITRLLNNQAIVSKQIMCVLEKSPCDQLGEQLKGSFSLIFVILNNIKY